MNMLQRLIFSLIPFVKFDLKLKASSYKNMNPLICLQLNDCSYLHILISHADTLSIRQDHYLRDKA